MTYTFFSAGSIPGIPGIFAGVAVEVDDASNTILSVSPLLNTDDASVPPPPPQPQGDAQPSLPPDTGA